MIKDEHAWKKHAMRDRDAMGTNGNEDGRTKKDLKMLHTRTGNRLERTMFSFPVNDDYNGWHHPTPSKLSDEPEPE